MTFGRICIGPTVIVDGEQARAELLLIIEEWRDLWSEANHKPAPLSPQVQDILDALIEAVAHEPTPELREQRATLRRIIESDDVPVLPEELQRRGPVAR